MVIDLPSRLRHPLSRQFYKAAAPLLERGLHIRSFNEVCERVRQVYREDPAAPSPGAWFGTAMKELGVRREVRLPEGFQMPSGPVIVVANHPFGLLDPLILGDLLASQRTDLRMIANFLLDGMEEIQPWLIPVDFIVPGWQPASGPASLFSVLDGGRKSCVNLSPPTSASG